jgi:dTDP-4-dehydrorhamnose 3,5-epimerase
MIFTETFIAGLFVVEPERHEDKRGVFARVFCVQEFSGAGIAFSCEQVNVSTNSECYTLRGMHYQDPPFAESKFVRVTKGRVFDVAVDVRPESPTFLKHFGIELTESNFLGLYLPEGTAHGFLTLESDTHVLYQMGHAYVPGKGKGLRWNDPALGIEWPAIPNVISERDAGYGDVQICAA